MKRRVRKRSRESGSAPRRRKRSPSASLPREGGSRAGCAGLSSGSVAATGPSPRLSVLAPIVPYADADLHRTVKVSTAELQTLGECLARAMDSQKRTIDALNFFSGQIDDERKVFSEARGAIELLVRRAARGN